MSDMSECDCKLCQYRDHIPKVTEAIKACIPSISYIAYISDESSIWDFTPEASELSELEKTLGVSVRPEDYLWEVAKRIGELAQSG